jgi:glutaredoxin
MTKTTNKKIEKVKHTLTLYVLPNCSHCREVMNKLNKKGVKYEEYVCGLNEMGFVSQHTEKMSMPVMLDETYKEVNYEELIK